MSIAVDEICIDCVGRTQKSGRLLFKTNPIPSARCPPPRHPAVLNLIDHLFPLWGGYSGAPSHGGSPRQNGRRGYSLEIVVCETP
jgi:hypothetical protein